MKIDSYTAPRDPETIVFIDAPIPQVGAASVRTFFIPIRMANRRLKNQLSMTFSYQFRENRKAQARTASNPTRAKYWAYLLSASLTLPSVASWAQTKPAAEDNAARSGGYVGLGINVAPRYQGADESRISGIPGFEYHWTNGLFAGGTDGLVGFQFDAARQLQLGVALGLDEGRKASDSRYLAGMGNVVARGTLNMHAKAAINDQFGLSAGLRLGSGNSAKGGLFNVGASYDILLAPATRMNINVEASFANADYMQAYFGVSAAQGSTSGYKRYTPNSGLRDVTVGLGLQHDISPEWMLFARLNSTKLSKAAKDSPLVRKTTSQSTFAGIAYRF